MFLDGVFYTKYWLNGTLVSDTPRDLDIVGTGVTFDTATGRARYTLPSGSGSGTPGGGSGELQYNNAGSFDGASGIKIGGSEAQLAFGGTVTVGGALNVPHNTKIARGRNGAGNADVDLWTWGAATDTLWIGDSSGLAAAAVLLKTGGSLTLNVNGTPEYTLDATAITLNGNNVVGAGFFSTNGTVPSSGFVRLANGGAGLTGVTSMNFAGSLALLLAATGSDDAVYIGGNNNTALYLRSGGAISMRPSGSASNTMSLTSTTLDIISTVIQTGTGTRANAGIVRMPKNPGTVLAYIAHDGTSTRNLLYASGDGTTFTDVVVGDSTATSGNNTLYLASKTQARIQIAATDTFVFDASTFSMISGKSIAFGTANTAGGSFSLRYVHGASLAGARNQANSQDVPLARFGVFVNDLLYIGSTSSDAGKVASMRFGIHTGGAFTLEVNGAAEYTFDSANLNVIGNGIINAALITANGTVASSGWLRSTANTSHLVSTDGSSHDLVLVATDGSNNAIFGSSTFGGTGGATILQGTDGGSGGLTLKVVGAGPVTRTAVFSTSSFTINTAFGANSIAFPNNAAPLITVTDTILGVRNVMDFGAIALNHLTIGSGITNMRFSSTNLGFFAATPVAKGTVTGSRGANAALASLLTLLATYGLLTDSST